MLDEGTATLKTCSKCGESKPPESFNRSARAKDGLWPWCKLCRNEMYRANPTAAKERARRRYEEHREPIKAYVQSWVEKNRDKARATKAAWAKRNPEYTRENWRRRHARQLAASVVPFTLTQLAEKMAYWGNRCWVCHGPEEAVDHVKPLAKGGLHVLANLRPICRACNTRKRDRWPYTPPAAA